jgi:hypothetical protein
MMMVESSKRREGRPTVPVRRSLEQRLLAYAAAASASLVAVQPARAKVIYTPIDLNITIGTISLDLNHDGVADFNILGSDIISDIQSLKVNGAGNVGAGVVANRFSGASALGLGKEIGPGEPFLRVQNANALMAWVEQTGLDSSIVVCHGAFANGPMFTYYCQGTRDRFLGLRFVVNGQTYYGWAGFSVVKIDTVYHARIHARLTGVAYEDVPGQSIRAGQLEDGAAMIGAAPDPQPCNAWSAGAGRAGARHLVQTRTVIDPQTGTAS